MNFGRYDVQNSKEILEYLENASGDINNLSKTTNEMMIMETKKLSAMAGELEAIKVGVAELHDMAEGSVLFMILALDSCFTDSALEHDLQLLFVWLHARVSSRKHESIARARIP